MPDIRLSAKGEILIPKELRRKLGLRLGGRVHLIEEKGRLVVSPVPGDPIAAAAGFLAGHYSLTADLRREHREELRRRRKARPR